MKKFHSQVRDVGRDYNSLRNHLLSIQADSAVVEMVKGFLPSAPLIANLRNGVWYWPEFDHLCYFKSTDGHDNQFAFSLQRLNLGTAVLVCKASEGIIVDSTRRGKAFPDSMRATIPIWMAVLNAIVLSDEASPSTSHYASYFTAAPFLPKSQARQIVAKLAELVQSIPVYIQALIKHKLAPLMRGRPLRPIWCCPCADGSIDWIGDYADDYICCSEPEAREQLPYIPVVLLSCSVIDKDGNADMREFQSWSYVQGAGDDEEHWAPRGFTSELFWRHREQILACDDSVVVYETAKSLVDQGLQWESLGPTGGNSTSNSSDNKPRKLRIEKVVPGLGYVRCSKNDSLLSAITSLSSSASSSSMISLMLTDVLTQATVLGLHVCGVITVNVDMATSMGVDSTETTRQPLCFQIDPNKTKDRDDLISTCIKESLDYFAVALLDASSSRADATAANVPTVLLIGNESDDMSVVVLASIAVAFYREIYQPEHPIGHPLAQSMATLIQHARLPQQRQLLVEGETAEPKISKGDVKTVLLWLQVQLSNIHQICSRQSMKDILSYFVPTTIVPTTAVKPKANTCV